MPYEQNRDQQGQDGSVRKAHYGDGKQPWDIIVEAGWGSAFAAANVVKYIRRTKNPEHSFESACWYYRQLITNAASERSHPEYGPPIWGKALNDLLMILTSEERDRIVAALKTEDQAKGVKR